MHLEGYDTFASVDLLEDHEHSLDVRIEGMLVVMADMMLKPSRQIIALHEIPADVINEAYTKNPEHKRSTVESLAKVRKLCEDLGLLRRPFGSLWRMLGLTTPR